MCLFMNKITNFLCLSLLLLGATVLGMNVPDEQLGQELIEAVARGDLEAVKGLIEQGVSVEAEDILGWNPLVWGAMNGREAMCRLLIENKASLEAKDNDGCTALSWAAGSSHEAMCRLLIANKASVEAKDNHGRTPLIYAVMNSHEDICRLLIDAQLEEARKNKAAIATFLGIVRKRSHHLPCHMQYDVAKLIARQAFESVRQQKQLVIEQINIMGCYTSIAYNLEMRIRLLEHLNRQMNVPINALKSEETVNKKHKITKKHK
jgi:ankyrin repeat protein